jgi:leucyl-tRNA synthetase
MNWDDDVKTGQKNWIGKKAGINIEYPVKGIEESLSCFTTRPDTNFGMTFIVLAPEHRLVKRILAGEIKVDKNTKQKVTAYVKAAAAKTEQDRLSEGRKKSGTFTGLYAINQLNGKEIPIWVADYVLANFGTGAVVGVPGHDLRDFEFAKAMDLEILRVVVGPDKDKTEITKKEQVQEKEGEMINSEFLNGIEIHQAIEKMMDHLEGKGWGKRVISFNLRDWCVSRQRYWGPPIPLIYCKDEAKQGKSWFNTSEEAQKMLSKNELDDLAKTMPGWFPDENLPVRLPEVAEFEKIKPDGSGKGPLASQPQFVNTVCPHCGKPAVRETDVSDPFVDSCWYFLRYPFTEYNNIPFGGDFENPKSHYHPTSLSVADAKKAVVRQKKWGPVTSYIGGKEHTVLHLLYARFITMVFYDLGYLDFEEPFDRFYGHGLITKDGAKMSKSKGNVVNPDEYIVKYGADSIRMYLRFLGPFDKGGDWRDTGMDGMYRFINKLWYVYNGHKENLANNVKINVKNPVDDSYLHQRIKAITEDLPELKFNTAVAEVMQLLNWYKENEARISLEKRSEYLSTLALLLAPLAPHIAEEFWGMLGNKGSVHLQAWPEFDKTKLVVGSLVIPVQVNGKVRDTLKIDTEAKQTEVEKAAQKLANVQKNIAGAKIKKIVYVKGKIINIIV